MERMISDIREKMESMYVDLASDEGGSCPFVRSCDPHQQCKKNGHNVWTDFMTRSNAQFQNAATATCTRFDKDAYNNPLSVPVTGRSHLYPSRGVTSNCNDCIDHYGDPARYASICPSCRCTFPIVKANAMHVEVFHSGAADAADATGVGVGRAARAKHDFLDATGCTSSTSRGKCYTNTAVDAGVNLPSDTGGAQCVQRLHGRVGGEVCATNQLTTIFRRNAATHSDLKWNFMGMQETGMYRNWPLIYQCRTEAQCSGCSDPRFRSWYASAASGPKDVVLVLDKSGSMASAGRMARMKTAAQWVINTLSEHDYAQVVAFSSEAESFEGGLGLVNTRTANRKRMKE